MINVRKMQRTSLKALIYRIWTAWNYDYRTLVKKQKEQTELQVNKIMQQGFKSWREVFKRRIYQKSLLSEAKASHSAFVLAKIFKSLKLLHIEFQRAKKMKNALREIIGNNAVKDCFRGWKEYVQNYQLNRRNTKCCSYLLSQKRKTKKNIFLQWKKIIAKRRIEYEFIRMKSHVREKQEMREVFSQLKDATFKRLRQSHEIALEKFRIYKVTLLENIFLT